jgi:hypothetical protein
MRRSGWLMSGAIETASGHQLRVGKPTACTGKTPRPWLFRFQWRDEWVRMTIRYPPQKTSYTVVLDICGNTGNG